MPYIDNIAKQRLHPTHTAQSPGELNYEFTMLLKRYIKTKGLNYQTINDILGALEGAKLEFYRRVAVPYENTKLSINGDVYD